LHDVRARALEAAPVAEGDNHHREFKHADHTE
jgi:hypothetical protein